MAKVPDIEVTIRVTDKRDIALKRVLSDLESPGWPHEYTKGIHMGDCRACNLLKIVRSELA